MRKIKNTMEVRRENLRLLIPQWGAEALAHKLGLANPNYLHQMLRGHRPFSEKTARRYERELDLPNGWFEEPHAGAKAAPAPVSDSLLTQACVAVGAALEDMGARINPRKFAEAVTLVYEDARPRGAIDDKYVERIVKLVKED